ncbi:hypothetical protein E8E11_003147 [Didymella keratinophila]|nr:hypothetical protein E8E11_003147 [Didymella keratinophila]
MFAADVLAGISALHKVGLQRNAFSVSDILLVWRQNSFYFQIAGIEACTCIINHEPTNNEEWKSLMNILQYVMERMHEDDRYFIEELMSYLQPHKVLGSAALQAGIAFTDPNSLLYKRKELEVYIHAVRVLGTTLGGVLDQKNKIK